MSITARVRYIITAVLILCVVSACSPHRGIMKEGPSVTKPDFEALPQEGQLPEEVVTESAERYGGSMDPQGELSASGVAPAGMVVVMGPITSEKGMVAIDAGQKIREVIAMVITTDGEVTLVDAPEERYINDSPRPDLAKRGIKAVIKGVASYSASSEKITIFLRSVDTATGNVLAIASGRNSILDDAATEASTLLMKKLKEVQ